MATVVELFNIRSMRTQCRTHTSAPDAADACSRRATQDPVEGKNKKCNDDNALRCVSPLYANSMPYARMWGLRGLRTTTTVAPLMPFPKRAGHAPPSPPTPHPFLRPPPSPPTQIISEVLRRHRHPAHTFLPAPAWKEKRGLMPLLPHSSSPPPPISLPPSLPLSPALPPSPS